MPVLNNRTVVRKLTINLDADLLNRVVEATGSRTKTEAITTALREVDRRARLVRTLRKGTGATPDELKAMFDLSSGADNLKVAEERTLYGGAPE